ncbi:hypothetical protein M0813_22702 [Anaeramoeba flamelloides]|uniref:Uncharacterized protein n=1 Tax=Anaeramoeba flamelloides TaxID=1746091 RepID=A0ABQ8YD77_9EUKA|nr:hypothetical protein M0813_22702 [Anaeramoeba flamelloides]
MVGVLEVLELVCSAYETIKNQYEKYQETCQILEKLSEMKELYKKNKPSGQNEIYIVELCEEIKIIYDNLDGVLKNHQKKIYKCKKLLMNSSIKKLYEHLTYKLQHLKFYLAFNQFQIDPKDKDDYKIIFREFKKIVSYDYGFGKNPIEIIKEYLISKNDNIKSMGDNNKVSILTISQHWNKYFSDLDQKSLNEPQLSYYIRKIDKELFPIPSIFQYPNILKDCSVERIHYLMERSKPKLFNNKISPFQLVLRISEWMKDHYSPENEDDSEKKKQIKLFRNEFYEKYKNKFQKYFFLPSERFWMLSASMPNNKIALFHRKLVLLEENDPEYKFAKKNNLYLIKKKDQTLLKINKNKKSLIELQKKTIEKIRLRDQKKQQLQELQEKKIFLYYYQIQKQIEVDYYIIASQLPPVALDFLTQIQNGYVNSKKKNFETLKKLKGNKFSYSKFELKNKKDLEITENIRKKLLDLYFLSHNNQKLTKELSSFLLDLKNYKNNPNYYDRNNNKESKVGDGKGKGKGKGKRRVNGNERVKGKRKRKRKRKGKRKKKQYMIKGDNKVVII